ncbi:MAG: THxN family PEP-CTERM protein [Leptolyngbyaceae cyanobacterium]
MNLQKLTVTVGVGWAVFAGAANAASLTTSGTWTPTAPGSGISGGGTNQISWGNPVDQEQSSYVFDGVNGSPTIQSLIDDVFLLGTFTHNNYVITGTTLEAATLNVQFDLDSFSETFSFDFIHDETPNSIPCNPSGATICPDVVSFLDNGVSQQVINLGGIDYNLSLKGFSVEEGGPLVNEFVTEENQVNTARLFAQLTEVEVESVPEPASLLGLMAVGGMAMALKRKQQHA